MIENVTVLFDFYHHFLNQNDPEASSFKYKTEMVVNSILGQMSYMRLLPDLLIQYVLFNRLNGKMEGEGWDEGAFLADFWNRQLAACV